MKGQEPGSGLESGAPRRRFLKLVAGVATTICGLALGVPLVSSLVGPSLRKMQLRWARVGEIASFPVEQPVSAPFSEIEKEAYIHEKVTHNVWVIKHPAGDVTVFSPICPHLGCRYDWHPNRRLFICPCHGSVWSIQGKVLAGPAPRPLDTLPHKTEDGELLVEWERFETGIAKKVRV
jgi:menaquinol-cytochrome c reductase iron-sulfur subunit